MFFYNEYTQNKEFSSLFLLSYVIRYLPVFIYTWDFIHMVINSELTGSHATEIGLVILMVFSGIWIKKPIINEESRVATFKHWDIAIQALTFLYSGLNLALVIYVSSSSKL